MSKFGTVVPHGNGWRARIEVDGTKINGPQRQTRPQAQADLDRARQCPSRTDMEKYLRECAPKKEHADPPREPAASASDVPTTVKQNPMCTFGSVVPHRNGWRARVEVDGRKTSGPQRETRAGAQDDLDRARHCESRHEMQQCLRELIKKEKQVKEEPMDADADDAVPMDDNADGYPTGKDSKGDFKGKGGKGDLQGKDGKGDSRGNDGKGDLMGKDSQGASKGMDGKGHLKGEVSKGDSTGKDGKGHSKGKHGKKQSTRKDGTGKHGEGELDVVMGEADDSTIPVNKKRPLTNTPPRVLSGTAQSQEMLPATGQPPPYKKGKPTAPGQAAEDIASKTPQASATSSSGNIDPLARGKAADKSTGSTATGQAVAAEHVQESVAAVADRKREVNERTPGAATIRQIWNCPLSFKEGVDWCAEMSCGRKFIEFRRLGHNKQVALDARMGDKLLLTQYGTVRGIGTLDSPPSECVDGDPDALQRFLESHHVDASLHGAVKAYLDTDLKHKYVAFFIHEVAELHEDDRFKWQQALHGRTDGVWYSHQRLEPVSGNVASDLEWLSTLEQRSKQKHVNGPRASASDAKRTRTEMPAVSGPHADYEARLPLLLAFEDYAGAAALHTQTLEHGIPVNASSWCRGGGALVKRRVEALNCRGQHGRPWRYI